MGWNEAAASQAVQLVHAGAKGVDELQPRLLLRQSQMRLSPTTDPGPLLEALREADSPTDLDPSVFSAAKALAAGAHQAERFETVLEAWRTV